MHTTSSTGGYDYICGTKFPEHDVVEEEYSEVDNSPSNDNDLIHESYSIYESNLTTLLMNGVYYYIEGGFRYLLKFSSDGVIQGTSDTNAIIPSASEIRSISYRDQGRYSLENDKISISLMNQNGQVDYWGHISKGLLTLSSHSHINGHRASNVVYKFVEI